jgi:UDP-N-acetylmuramate: L-alanyl-gamma-D-glutamyl-meso-diaminopimelate ligase
LRAAGKTAEAFDTADAIADFVSAHANSGDVILVMSNGSFDGLCGKLQERLSTAKLTT